jgi:hypothetical protein
MGLYKTFFVFLFLIFTISCKKNINNEKTIISGRLLESSSNPIPIANYNLTLNQNQVLTPFGSLKGIEQTVTTDNDGNFLFSYSLEKGSGIGAASTNSKSLYISSNDKSKYNSLFPEFNPISVGVDTSLNTIYLYKKINKLVRKVKFENALKNDEILQVITIDDAGTKYNNLKGPIPIGTTLIVDTIENYKNSRLNLQTKKYTLLSVLKKPTYQKDLNILLDIGDEFYREILMTY